MGRNELGMSGCLLKRTKLRLVVFHVKHPKGGKVVREFGNQEKVSTFETRIHELHMKRSKDNRRS